MTTITIAQLEAAINRARSAQPSAGAYAALSSDVALMADVYGAMIYAQCDAMALADLSEPQGQALARWLNTPTAPESAGRAPG